MILIIGGAFQGKKGFAKQLFLSERKPGKGEEPKEIPWCDGETASWEEFSKASWCFHLAAMVRRQMDESAVGKEDGLLRDGFTREDFVKELLENSKEKILVAEEIGSGIVPIDAFQRKWREETGRIYCLLAENASQVWRITGGIGQRLR